MNMSSYGASHELFEGTLRSDSKPAKGAMRRFGKTALAYLVLLWAGASAHGVQPGCVPLKISAGGEPVVTRFLAAPLARAHEAVADAMQAAGVFLFRDTEGLIEGERTQERVAVLALPRGDEAIRAELVPSSEAGKPGTQVRVETRRGRNKKGKPKHIWSAAVLEQAGCLLDLMSLDDPIHRTKTEPADGPLIQIADATRVAVRSRRFFFETELKAHKLIPFETSEDLIVDNSVAVPAGSLVMASVGKSNDIGEFGRGAQGQLQFVYAVLPDGTKLPLRGIVDLRGKGNSADLNNAEKSLLIATSIVGPLDLASGTGTGFAVPAGTLFYAEVDGNQKFHARRAVTSDKP